MVVDVHCHILPGVDDGAKDERSTKEMLKLASEEGIDVIIATPHFAYELKEKKQRDRLEKYEKVRAWWKMVHPKKELYLGNEILYSEGVVEALTRGEALTMNGTRYVLVEFPEYESFDYIRIAVQRLLYAGYLPIIAHVERYAEARKLKHIEELVDIGAYIQVNAAVILGKRGFVVKHQIMKLLKRGLVHFIGTDAHDTVRRKPEMKECRRYLEKKIGISMTRWILEENPQRMLKGEEVR